MKIFAALAVLFSAFASSANANGLSDLKSNAVWAAAQACRAATFGCATEYQVFGDERHNQLDSCHNVNKAVDIVGTNSCLNAFAICLSAQPYVLYCYKNWWIGGIVHWRNSGVCRQRSALIAGQ